MSPVDGDVLRGAMREWTTGVAVVTSRWGDSEHGMTVNSLSSVCLDPAMVSVNLAHGTRTQQMVEQSGFFGVTILAEDQAEIADRFAGRIAEEQDRFHGLELYILDSGAAMIRSGLVSLDCRVVQSIALTHSTLYIAEVIAVQHNRAGDPLIYHQRVYHRLGK